MDIACVCFSASSQHTLLFEWNEMWEILRYTENEKPKGSEKGLEML